MEGWVHFKDKEMWLLPYMSLYCAVIQAFRAGGVVTVNICLVFLIIVERKTQEITDRAKYTSVIIKSVKCVMLKVLNHKKYQTCASFYFHLRPYQCLDRGNRQISLTLILNLNCKQTVANILTLSRNSS